jgi:hypothetical protein
MDNARRQILSEHPEQLDPSVSSARRVSTGRQAGSLDQAIPLISITTWARRAPAVISQSQPHASTCARVPVKVGRDLPTHHTTLGDTTLLPVPRHPREGPLVTVVWAADRSGLPADHKQASTSSGSWSERAPPSHPQKLEQVIQICRSGQSSGRLASDRSPQPPT